VLRNTPDSYGLVTKVLHWSIAGLIFGLIGLGRYMVDLTYFDRWYNASLAWHRVLGLVVLLLAALFVGWKAVSPSPLHPRGLPRLQRIAAVSVHLALMLMMFLLPVTGYLISTSAGKPIDVFGLFEVPVLFPVDRGLRDLAIDVHYYAAYATGVLALGHAGAALKHQFIDRDGLLARMLWR